MTNDCSQETGSSSRVWIGSLLIAGIAAVSLVLIYQPVKIQGNSMTPLLTNDDHFGSLSTIGTIEAKAK